MPNITYKSRHYLFILVYDICRLQTADRRLQTADIRRPQIADCQLKDNKNLPNKGDTVKNITSCESEKVPVRNLQICRRQTNLTQN